MNWRSWILVQNASLPVLTLQLIAKSMAIITISQRLWRQLWDNHMPKPSGVENLSKSSRPQNLRFLVRYLLPLSWVMKRMMKTWMRLEKKRKKRGGRIRKRKRRPQRWKESKQWLHPMLLLMILMRRPLRMMMTIMDRIMIAPVVLKILTSKRISNSSRCDCYNSRAACWAVRDLADLFS